MKDGNKLHTLPAGGSAEPTQCAGRPGAMFPLTMGASDEKVCVVRIPAGQGTAERLASMGIQQGDVVKVVQNQGGSLLIETAAGGRYVLGGGMANKIYVTRE